MSVIVARFQAKPGKEAELEALLRRLVVEVEKETGTLQYVLHRERDAKGAFLFYERYASEADLQNHVASPFLQNALTLSAELIAEPFSVVFCDEIAAVKR